MSIKVKLLPPPPIAHVLQSETPNEKFDKDYYWRFANGWNVAFWLNGELHEIAIPKDFCSDGGSIPRLAGSLRGIAFRSYFLHDWLYSQHNQFSRKQVDQILKACLLVEGVCSVDASMIYMGVRLGGGSHWVE